MSCVIAGQPFAARLSLVLQVLIRPNLIELESPPEGVVGLTTWRGQVIPVLKTAQKLLVPAPARQEARLVLVVKQGSDVAGIAVDEVRGLFRVGGVPLRPPSLEEGVAVNLTGLGGLVTPVGGQQSLWELNLDALCTFTTPFATAYEAMRVSETAEAPEPQNDLFVTFEVENVEYALRLASLRRLISISRISNGSDPAGERIETITDGPGAIPLLDLRALSSAFPSHQPMDDPLPADVAEGDAASGGAGNLPGLVGAVWSQLRKSARELLHPHAHDTNAAGPGAVPEGAPGGAEAEPQEQDAGRIGTVLVLEKELKVVGIAVERLTGLIRGANGGPGMRKNGVLLVKSSQSGKPIRMLDDSCLIDRELPVTRTGKGPYADGREERH
ncbi:chemotaxis protein CheW [Geomesophilobacter sediminis]|uniref:Chemotaxis protein CheW n=1 Tax=Geomesophilobacter sediminis TaxID=2798584 RepID=A0A8J7JGC8_9BACT|nr:chemotaxis protein CheW [Geomesophilobacter sediminis]MBJ6725739.1 chemotaxis protein CheW [Geomesophilobacter sediminis]